LKQAAALILLCLFILLQYGRQLNYYYCLMNAAAPAINCVCTDADNNKDIHPPAAPPQKTGKSFFADESFTINNNNIPAPFFKMCSSFQLNHYNHCFYNYRHINSPFKPPQFYRSVFQAQATGLL
jgi:hypothetical protein